jgi:hypothetical protein
MVRAIKISLVVLLLCGFFAGCRPKEKPIWEKVKASDIPPAKYDGKSGPQRVQTGNFNIYVYEIPQKNFEKISELWEPLSKQGIYLLDYQAFSSNSFRADLGRATSFGHISKVLQDASSKIVNRYMLLIPLGESQEVEVVYLDRQQSIFHISADGSMTGHSLGPGYLVMRFLAKEIASMMGVSNVQFSVVFRPPFTTLHTLEIRPKKGEYLFPPTLFNVNMGAGDLFVLSPKKPNQDRSTLDGLFFGQGDGRDVFRLYLIICTGVTF